jgi:hypothetical protein
MYGKPRRKTDDQLAAEVLRKKATGETSITDRVWFSGQAWRRERIIIIDGYRARFSFKADFYKLQSYAKAYVWKDDAWSLVDRVAGEQMYAPCRYREDTPPNFDVDYAPLEETWRLVVLGRP